MLKRKVNQKTEGLDKGREEDRIFGNRQCVGFSGLSEGDCG